MSLKIQYCSDLHLEFDKNSTFLKKHPLKVSGEVLVLAGDIVPLHDEHFRHPFFSFLADHYEQVFWVPGNHEFYHKDMMDYSSSFEIDLRSNIKLLHNKAPRYKEVRFVCSTLWSNISDVNARLLESSVSDFHCIEKGGRKFKASDFNQLHLESYTFLEKTMEESFERTIVVTHHLPAQDCNLPAHKKSLINEAFCVDLTSFVSQCNAKFWVYGHSHFNQKPLFKGNTVLLTNQLGYVDMNEHKTFKRNAFIVV